MAPCSFFIAQCTVFVEACGDREEMDDSEIVYDSETETSSFLPHCDNLN